MRTFEFEIKLEASSPQEAEAKIAALTTLASKLKANELLRLAYIVKHDPVKTALAKKYLGV